MSIFVIVLIPNEKQEGSDFAKKAEHGMGLIISSAEEADHLI